MDKKHEWKYYSLGGVVRVNISSGEDLAHLDELDQKLWTVLSCPVDGLELDRRTLEFIDSDKDGKIKVREIVDAAKFLTSVIRNKDLILEGNSTLKLDDIDRSTEKGEQLYKSAHQILENLGRDSNEISADDAADSTAIFKGTKANGDGVITHVSTDDEALKKVIGDCVAQLGGITDRNGETGVTAEKIEEFYAACSDYSAWLNISVNEKDTVMPYGEDTPAAYVTLCALKDKVADYFMRCKLIQFNPDSAGAVDSSVEKIAAVSEGNLAVAGGQIAAFPLARPNAANMLPLNAVNPAWTSLVNKFRTLVIEKEFPGADEIGEAQWNTLCAKFDAYASWLSAKKGEAVEALGAARVNEILASDSRQALLDLVAADKALEQESDSIDEVKKLMLLYRDFARLLRNYITFSDFYARVPGVRSLFEVGQLYVDQRCCDFCIRVTDMSKHSDMAKLSGMFLIYCKCTSRVRNKTMNIVAVLTEGDIADLRPGKNGIFYDCHGGDWDAVITKVVDNPISIRQAFLSPYRKFWEFCVGLINKSAAEKESKVISGLQEKAVEAKDNPPAAAPAQDGKAGAFDIAKFAGIFAALGMAVGYIGSFLTQLVTGITKAEWWQLLIAIPAIMLVISGPSCFIAWSKLRKRNLGPVLNANGWAINSKVLVNILFGNKLTTVAVYPKLKLIADPYRKAPSSWWKWVLGIVIAAGLLAAVYFVLLKCFGIDILCRL